MRVINNLLSVITDFEGLLVMELLPWVSDNQSHILSKKDGFSPQKSYGVCSHRSKKSADVLVQI